jgi:ParB/RepB/Spo0J family partition protein
MAEQKAVHKRSGLLGGNSPKPPVVPPANSAYLDRMKALAKSGASDDNSPPPLDGEMVMGEAHPTPAPEARADQQKVDGSVPFATPTASHAPVSEEKVGQLVLLRVRSIKPSPYQPRVKLDPAHVAEIAESVRVDTLNDPITVRPYKRIDGDHLEWEFELIAGENRLEAFKLLDEEFIPAIIKLYDDRTAARMAVFSNKKRGGYKPYEEFRGYKMLLDQGFVKSQNQMAIDAEMSKTEMSRMMSYAKLPPGAHEMLTRNPALIGSNASAALVVYAERPDYEQLVVGALEKVEAGELDQLKAAIWVEKQIVTGVLATYTERGDYKDLLASALKKVDAGEVDHASAAAWVEQQIKAHPEQQQRQVADKRAATWHGGRTFATIKPGKHGFQIDLDKQVQLQPQDQERFEVALLEFVTTFAKELPEQ